MNRFLLRTLAVVIVVAALPLSALADNRRGSRGEGGRQPRTEQRGQRQGSNRQQTVSKQKDEKRDNKNAADVRRQENQHKNPGVGRRPDNRPAPGQRPGAGQPGAPNRWGREQHNRPVSPAHRPVTPHRPPHPVAPPPPAPRPVPRPGHHGAFAPHPPHAPFYVHAPRPIPRRPHAWRPVGRPISFGKVLFGLTLGAAFNFSLEYLYDNGYAVGGYGNDAIYLNNVNMFNYLWPEASMFYSGGRLVSTVYTYSSPYNDGARYNSILNMMTSGYGAPYVTPTSNGMSSTWWNGDGSYVTLSYESAYGSDGRLGYFTTLTFGN